MTTTPPSDTEIPLTLVQQQVLHFIRSFQDAKGFSPTIGEISEGLKLRSKSSVYYQLQKLEDRGYIRRERNIQRSIVVIKDGGTEGVAP